MITPSHTYRHSKQCLWYLLQCCVFLRSLSFSKLCVFLALTTEAEKSLSGDNTAYEMARMMQPRFSGNRLEATAVNSCPADVAWLPACLPARRPTGLPAGLPACLRACLSVCLPVCLSVSLVCLSVCLSTCLSVYLLVYLSICLSIYLSIYLCMYNTRGLYCLRELYEADSHKPGIFGSGRVWTNACDVFRRTPS